MLLWAGAAAVSVGVIAYALQRDEGDGKESRRRETRAVPKKGGTQKGGPFLSIIPLILFRKRSSNLENRNDIALAEGDCTVLDLQPTKKEKRFNL